MFTGWVSRFLPAFLLCSATTTGAEIISASRGETVHLPLPLLFEMYGQVAVEWVKDGEVICTYQIAENHTIMSYSCKPQFTVNTEGLGLTITGVTSSNAGLYNCTVTRLIPPPIEDRFSLFEVKVSAGLVLQKLNSSDAICVELLCSLEGLHPEQVNFTWTIADQKLLYNQNSNMSSTLRLCKPDWQDGDTLTCHASRPHNYTVYSKSITLQSRNTGGHKTFWLVVISSIGACVGLLLILFLSMATYKYKKKRMAGEPIVFHNKVYENFRFFSARPNPEATAVSLPRPNCRSNPQRGPGKQGEESIYEN